MPRVGYLQSASLGECDWSWSLLSLLRTGQSAWTSAPGPLREECASSGLTCHSTTGITARCTAAPQTRRNAINNHTWRYDHLLGSCHPPPITHNTGGSSTFRLLHSFYLHPGSQHERTQLTANPPDIEITRHGRYRGKSLSTNTE